MRWSRSTGCSIILLFFVCGCLVSCSGDERSGSRVSSKTDSQVATRVRTFCGNCHAYPSPDSFPRAAWPGEVVQGYNFYYQSLRTDLVVPPMQETIDYYLRHAPEKLEAYKSRYTSSLNTSATFHRQLIDVDPVAQGDAPAVAHVKWGRLDSESGGVFTCDMRSGVVAWVPASGESGVKTRVLCQLENPCHLEPTDLDSDGRRDFVIADLGHFYPEDHQRGKLWWLHSGPAGNDWKAEILVDGLARVCDAQPADFNRDGKMDLVVAEFGWRQTGRVLLFENKGIVNGLPDYQMTILDDRHGSIHVPVTDLNADGWPDFVVLISQEYEIIEAFLNNQDGTFDRQPIYSAGSPSFGSSGIQLVDMDRDGDLDVLHTNGDSFDSDIVKPYHGIRWLENQGTFPFQEHFLGQLPGVHRALAGDLDQDGDLDVVAVSLLPHPVMEASPPNTFDAVTWLEQVSPGEFVGRAISKGPCHHATCELADWNNDGRLDIIVGEFRWENTKTPSLIWYENRAVKKKE